MEKYTYIPNNVCSNEINFEIEENIVKNIEITGGCPGNSIGVALLCKGKKIDEVISLLNGITCKNRNTSCPDQLVQGLIKYKQERS